MVFHSLLIYCEFIIEWYCAGYRMLWYGHCVYLVSHCVVRLDKDQAS